MKKNTVNLGLLGLGTVGSETLSILHRNKKNIEQKIGAQIHVSYLCDNDLKRLAEKSKKYGIKASNDWKKVVNDPDIDIIIELIGGKGIAKEAIIAALKSKKNVVTANKAILAQNWDEIFDTAQKNNKLVYFEASVGSAIPVIQSLNEGLAANRINYIAGIFNGTTNYIFTKMFREGLTFEEALKLAQLNGFAEADPKFDIEGIDAANKLSILSSIAWSRWVKLENIYCEGVSSVDPIDIKFAYKEFGCIMKLLGVARRKGDTVELSVRPSLISKDHLFSSVENEFNSILLNGDSSGEIMLYGKGAGGPAAASAVVSDIMFLARQVAAGTDGSVPYVNNKGNEPLMFTVIGGHEGRYYLRFTAVDKPGVLSKITSILAKHKVSIADLFQNEPLENRDNCIPILMVTHTVKEALLRNALKEINKLSIIKSKSVLIRIEDMSA